jgi:hypothetical protein
VRRQVVRRFALLALFCSLVSLLVGCGTSIRRDHLIQPKKQGTRLTALGFIGPGARATVDNRVDVVEGESQLRSQLRGDVNFGYSEISGHADLRWLIFTLGGSVGYRYGWHTLQFTPDANGLDHGEPELNRDARIAKDEDDDFYDDTWFYGEGRFQVVAPWENVMALSTVSYRHEARRDATYSWEYATVYDGGELFTWETQIFLRHRNLGFIGPTVRLLNLPRGGERQNEFHYGIAGGTTPGWSDVEHALVLRIYTNAGFDDDLMGTHFFRIPVHLILGYQQDFEL